MWTANETAGDAFGVCGICNPQTLGGKGWLGTVGGGFDYQFSEHIVAGLLADYDFESIKGTLQDISFFSSGTLKETSSWAAGARMGWLMTPQILSYVNGGATGTRFSGVTMVSLVNSPTANATPAFSKTGWFLGGGAETTMAPFLPAGWFMRSEYRYAFYGIVRTTHLCHCIIECGLLTGT